MARSAIARVALVAAILLIAVNLLILIQGSAGYSMPAPIMVTDTSEQVEPSFTVRELPAPAPIADTLAPSNPVPSHPLPSRMPTPLVVAR